MNKYEQLIEHIINEDEQAAKELFHQLVVEKSRDIYESLMDEDLGGNQAQGFVQDITNQDESAQDMGLGEDDDLDDLDGDDEFGTDDDADDMDHEETFGGDDMDDMDDMGDMGDDKAEHSEIESKIDDLSAQLEELKNMLAGEDHDMGHVDTDMHNDLDMDDMHKEGTDMPEATQMSGSGTSGSGMKEAKSMSGSGKSGSGKSGSGTSGSGKSGSGMKESYRKTDVEIMQEYVNKIGEIYKVNNPNNETGKTVGTGGDEPTVNKKSTSLEKGPDFGGTSDNLLNGMGNEEAPDGKVIPMPKNEYSKGEKEQPLATKDGGYRNKIGGNEKYWTQKGPKDGHGAEKKSGAEGTNVGAKDTMGRNINKKGELGGAGQPTGKK